MPDEGEEEEQVEEEDEEEESLFTAAHDSRGHCSNATSSTHGGGTTRAHDRRVIIHIGKRERMRRELLK
jgi:hypothetical protein